MSNLFKTFQNFNIMKTQFHKIKYNLQGHIKPLLFFFIRPEMSLLCYGEVFRFFHFMTFWPNYVLLSLFLVGFLVGFDCFILYYKFFVHDIKTIKATHIKNEIIEN